MFRNHQDAAPPVQPSHAAMNAANNAPSPNGVTVHLRYGSITGPKGEPLTEIRLRAPTAGDWMECGDFQTTKILKGDDGEIGSMVFEVDTRAVEKWLPRLSGIPLPLLKPMDYRDFRTLFNTLASMIGPYTKGN